MTSHSDQSVVDIIVFLYPTHATPSESEGVRGEKNKYHSVGDVRSRHATFFFYARFVMGVADDENWVHAVIAADVDGRYFGLVCKRADCSRGGVSSPPQKKAPRKNAQRG